MPTPVHQPLTSAKWTVRVGGDLAPVPAHIRGRTIAATVPGCIHTDLMDAGLIPDPAIGDNEKEVQWVSHADWRYECTFHADTRLFDHHEIDLVFDCLDTIATIELNGDRIGDAASEFIPHRFSILGLLKPGSNHLAITFKSPLRHIHEEAARLGPRPVNGDWDPFVFIRKCASNFQWDWGPKVATCGIASGVRLHAWSIARFDGLERIARYQIDFKPRVLRSRRSTEALDLVVSVTEGDGKSVGDCVLGAGDAQFPAELAFDFSDFDSLPKHWWPAGEGPQNLYHVDLRLRAHCARLGVSPKQLDTLEFGTGICDLALTQFFGTGERQQHLGEEFPLRVNDRPILCRGVNWIPEGLWPRDRTPDRVRTRLLALRDANINMIRVWGGGRYEPDWFYDLCDELGIMVWQDFMFSCGMYPEEEPLRSLIEAEARHQVARLSRHPSVILWCGGNECVWAYENWGWKEKLKKPDGTEQTWGRGYYLGLLPRIVAELDPTRPYWPNSPHSPSLREGAGGRANSAHASMPPTNDPSAGDRHTWDVWGHGYRTVTPRFCSEFGQQSPSNWATLAEAGLIEPQTGSIEPQIAQMGTDGSKKTETGSSDPCPSVSSVARLLPASLLRRQRGPGGLEGFGTPPLTPMQRWYDQPMSAWFREPRSFEEWHYLAQLLQARSISIGIEWLRINQPTCSGALIWQANDAWPGFSWSIIDSAGRKKLAWYAVKRSFAPRILSIHPIDGRPALFAVNDTDQSWESLVIAKRVDFDGRKLAEADIPLEVPARSTARLTDLSARLGNPGDPRRELIRVQAGGESADYFYLPDKDLALPDPRFDFTTSRDGDTLHLRVTARTLLRDLCLFADQLNPAAVSDSQLFTLLPGESHAFRLDGIPATAQDDPRAAIRLVLPAQT